MNFRKLTLANFILVVVIFSFPMFLTFLGNAFAHQTGPLAINIFFILFWPGVCLSALFFGSSLNISAILILGLIANLIYWNYLYQLVLFFIKNFQEREII